MNFHIVIMEIVFICTDDNKLISDLTMHSILNSCISYFCRKVFLLCYAFPLKKLINYQYAYQSNQLQIFKITVCMLRLYLKILFLKIQIKSVYNINKKKKGKMIFLLSIYHFRCSIYVATYLARKFHFVNIILIRDSVRLQNN